MEERPAQDTGDPTPPPSRPQGAWEGGEEVAPAENPPPAGWLVGETAAPETHSPAADTAPSEEPAASAEIMDRRGFFSRASSIAMGTSLVASYGVFAAMAGRFLYPARPPLKGWLYVADISSFRRGDSISYTAPDGATIAIARQGSAGSVEDFIALSSTCPHLGCKVHWEAQGQRFFCPCHNGAFDPSGKATAGPPAEAGQSLGRYPLRVEGGLLFVEVPFEALPGPEEM